MKRRRLITIRKVAKKLMILEEVLVWIWIQIDMVDLDIGELTKDITPLDWYNDSLCFGYG
jgi:hypothetical protein